jgi:hypothetical protein
MDMNCKDIFCEFYVNRIGKEHDRAAQGAAWSAGRRRAAQHETARRARYDTTQRARGAGAPRP